MLNIKSVLKLVFAEKKDFVLFIFELCSGKIEMKRTLLLGGGKQ